MILIIDNYDSFTQNLRQYVGELGHSVLVARNDNISISQIENINPTHIIISPGPGRPENSGACLNIIKEYANKKPILGICLGHQNIGYVFGGQIIQLNKPIHGKVSHIKHDETDIFKNISNPFKASRYHSLIIDKYKLPKDLDITAWTSNGIIMGCRHKIYKKLRGIQFHPESLWTQEGKNILKNFLSL
uniref:Anthranilate synthase component 2 n=1 Tax=Kuetzingia canaliculata TaxID=228262 RepID=A0A1Z1MPW7_KUECA|nr:Anthranilate synthase component II [Kuetzingia canaliculata]ARW67794.1 Anthranilate synthase component II [Kuetzingia canaliculata]